MAQLDDLKNGLEAELSRLSQRYIAQYIPADPEHTPETFEYDVKAYSLLSHAAFEEFAESVSDLVMNKVVADIMTQRVTLSTVCLLMAYKQFLPIDPRDDEVSPSCFNIIRLALAESKAAHSKTIKDNHGFSIKYLRNLLLPVGINIPSGPEIDAVKKLANARGSFAHTAAKRAEYGEYRQATKVLTPEEAMNTVTDCLDVCVRIKNQAELIVAAP